MIFRCPLLLFIAETFVPTGESRLFAVVVHIGRGPNHGHYVAMVKSGGRWLLFDDEVVELVSEQVRLGLKLECVPTGPSRRAS